MNRGIRTITRHFNKLNNLNFSSKYTPTFKTTPINSLPTFTKPNDSNNNVNKSSNDGVNNNIITSTIMRTIGFDQFLLCVINDDDDEQTLIYQNF
ncbi:hypothetical protein DDB_G0286949 [Dictyostelium discoideum AX4]|uniref:Putative uncharacterized protein DDB_G0286949 n=1 Tax=Dictyostelium discoideum TaxID=44689 RepID=Y7206_DICDI|nr:hypothetical protein DDB_G0286949 [Dictyostelium discoideum AX4]Q54L22.1 RecName: Full=Putative uncharacterized protein DDB_G0286949 [Dictyostelium discoideum]EAL63972.1 hypothetical protein DDB_G0286949 [Dictyostelium discoideum AX4]|eukprot:XP_637481.1 hypothetical protein DDB_G0286949 [Dictyostelium discoideum AX4]